MKENVICLLCGDAACYLQKCCNALPGMRDREGELTYHTRLYEGGISLYISTSSGDIIMIDGDRSASKPSPYMNKFGESFNKSSKRWENFYLDEVGGGKLYYDDFKKKFMNFEIPNIVIQERSNKDYLFRLRAI